MLPHTKLYIQFEPDSDGQASLRSAQQALPVLPRTRLVNTTALHMTVLHIGTLQRLVDAIVPYSTMPSEHILANANQLVYGLQQAVTACNVTTVTLQPVGAALFGIQKSTYAIVFDSVPVLDAFHLRCLGVLKKFLRTCAVNDTEKCIRRDENLKYTTSLRPHVTIAKSYYGQMVRSNIQPITLSIMPIVYAPRV